MEKTKTTLRGLATISYFAENLQDATNWYTELLGIEPYYTYPRKKYFGLYFTSKPEFLWIDSDMIDIKRDELINILNRELHNYNKKSNNNSVKTYQS